MYVLKAESRNNQIPHLMLVLRSGSERLQVTVVGGDGVRHAVLLAVARGCERKGVGVGGGGAKKTRTDEEIVVLQICWILKTGVCLL